MPKDNPAGYLPPRKSKKNKKKSDKITFASQMQKAHKILSKRK